MATKQQATLIFQRADEAWGEGLLAAFGKDACNARYQPRGAGAPGSRLRTLHDRRDEARRLWEWMTFGTVLGTASPGRCASHAEGRLMVRVANRVLDALTLAFFPEIPRPLPRRSR